MQMVLRFICKWSNPKRKTKLEDSLQLTYYKNLLQSYTKTVRHWLKDRYTEHTRTKSPETNPWSNDLWQGWKSSSSRTGTSSSSSLMKWTLRFVFYIFSWVPQGPISVFCGGNFLIYTSFTFLDSFPCLSTAPEDYCFLIFPL